MNDVNEIGQKVVNQESEIACLKKEIILLNEKIDNNISRVENLLSNLEKTLNEKIDNNVSKVENLLSDLGNVKEAEQINNESEEQS
jgi:hypothetical protein